MKTITLPFKMLLCIFILYGQTAFSQDPAQYGTPFSGVSDPRDANIYRVGVGEFCPTRNLQGVINRLDSIKTPGINAIYLMPIYPVGVLNVSGSPYCIRDFKAVNSSIRSLLLFWI